ILKEWLSKKSPVSSQLYIWFFELPLHKSLTLYFHSCAVFIQTSAAIFEFSMATNPRRRRMDMQQGFQDIDWKEFNSRELDVGLINLNLGPCPGKNGLACGTPMLGRVLRSQEVWVFGGICRETKECFVAPVLRRDEATLLPLIQNNIESGSHIVSDMWAAYRNIQTKLQGYTHSSVNHSENFVDPTNPTVHTQNVENMWGRLKTGLPDRLSDEQKSAYFCKFMYEQKYEWKKLTSGERFRLICKHISHIYPGPFETPWT
ncbi:hypothetical protein B4U79_11355, partial [Dinothrombium tinctorium]